MLPVNAEVHPRLEAIPQDADASYQDMASAISQPPIESMRLQPLSLFRSFLLDNHLQVRGHVLVQLDWDHEFTQGP
jgi:hypothetical protein